MVHNVKGYSLNKSEYIKEIDCTVHLFEHDKTKARILYMENDDPHKTFGITFRTPPHDSTGVPHIIEHSVLCGSRKFPLKDPFMELSKGSLNTYLNAMTYPDKTIYPISSQNDADFQNLMDVYLDAVFFPNIYKNDYILMQEGWRYHIEDKEAPLEYKGVVYNEMKGAFSSPEEVGFRKIKEALFPDTTYHNESGGAPEAIVDLSYEDFIAFHKKYYHPSNSYIGLYGKIDIDEVLTFIDKEYLSHFEYQPVDSTVATQEPFKEAKEVTTYYSVAKEKPNQLYVSYNCVTGETIDRELMVGLAILEYVLLETPASPLKKALLNEGIGEDVFGAFQTHLKQPIFSIMAKNVGEDKKSRFYEVVEETLRGLVQTGIPKTLLNGALQVKEFELREGDFKGYSKGLLYYIGTMKSWIYDEDPTIYLRYETILENLKAKKDTGYFEELIEKYLLDNTHSIKMVIEPKVGLDSIIEEKVKNKLAKIKEEWNEETLQAHIDKTLAFNKMQQTPDSVEAVHAIPLLTREELDQKSMFPRFKEEMKNDTKYIISPLFTNQVVYLNHFIDLEGVPEESLPYLGMLVGMLSKLDTKSYKYEDLSMTIDEHLGGIEFHIQALHQVNHSGNFKKVFLVKTKALFDQLEEQVNLVHEIINETSFEDRRRIREIIKEMKSMMEMSLSSEGHKIAYGVLLAGFSPAEYFDEMTKGLVFYQKVCEIDEQWETMEEEVISNLKKAYDFFMNRSRYTIGLTVDEELVSSCMDVVDKGLSRLEARNIESTDLHFKPRDIKEGLIYPGNVNYVAMGYNFKKLGFDYNGGYIMLKTILSMDYLWNEVRVKNGAYGCFADFRKSGNMFFVSYRDPNVEKTLEIYRGIPDYVEGLNLNEREMLQYLIGTISSMDFPFTASTEGYTGQIYSLVGTTQEDIQQVRDEIFGTTNETLRSFAPVIRKVIDENQYCVFGNTTSIAENRSLFTTTINI
nr:insulinase family protein [uncultured Niameybacter sp.]